MKKHTIPMLLVVITTTLAACMQKPQQAPPAPEEKPDPLAALQLDTLDEDSLDLKYATEMLRPGTAAPEFALPTLTGDTLRLSDFGGKWLVLDFWASWCPDCRQDVPNIQRLYETYHDRGIAFAAISFDTDREAWKKAVEQYAIPYPQASELRKFHDTEIAAAYGVKWIPSLYLISPDGRVALGTVLSSRMERALEKVAKPKPSEKPLDPRDYEIDEDGALRPRLPR